MLTKIRSSQHQTAYSPSAKIAAKPLGTIEFPPVANVYFLSCYTLFNMAQYQHKAIIWQLHLCV